MVSPGYRTCQEAASMSLNTSPGWSHNEPMRGIPVLVLLLVPALVSACGGDGDGSSPPPQTPPAPTEASTAAPASVGDPKVSTELRQAIHRNATCGDGDVCG